MDKLRHLFDNVIKKNSIDPKRVKFAVFHNTDLGPTVLYQDDTYILDLFSQPFELENFAIATMIAATQGSYYTNDVFLLPVSSNRNYHALIITRLIKDNKPVHERYFQYVLFIPNEYIQKLPIIRYKFKLLRIINNPLYFDLENETLMQKLKIQLLNTIYA